MQPQVDGAGALLGRRILIFEDDIVSANEIEQELGKQGGVPVRVRDAGADPVELTLRLKPDAIVMDALIFNADGWTVARRILSATTVPIVMLTMRSEDEVLRRMGEVRICGRVSKPFTMGGLLSELATCLGCG